MSSPGRYSLQAGWVIFAVLLLRLPFLNQAIQGDDFYYLKGAEHALIDPLHPNHAEYIFQGDLVSMRGHPHPPLNAWYLAALLAIFKSVDEPVFHAAYIPFSFIAALSVLYLARRFTPAPLLATLLFIATPAFVVNGNSLESDLPFVAFFLAAIAACVAGRYGLSALASVLAALAAYQAVVLTPILAVWIWRERRPWLRPSAAVLAAPATVAAYQLFERLTSGALPAAALAGYMNTYSLQTLAAKGRNAAALTAHAGWLVFPALSAAAFRRVWIAGAAAAFAGVFIDPNPLFWASFGIGAMLLAYCVTQRDFLGTWILIFFAAALVIFFAGSARYLLPVAAPAAMLAAASLPRRWLAAGIAANAAIGLLLAIVNYQHWDGYRDISANGPRVFTNAEWGLRHYLESRGARAIRNGQAFWPGDVIVTTAYANRPDNLGAASIVNSYEIQSSIPLRIVGLGARSGYSSAIFGLRPFDISRAPLDRVNVHHVADIKPTLSELAIGTPEAAAQIVSGIYSNDRWTGERATVVLKRPAGAATLDAEFFIADQSPARTITLYADGREIARQTYPGSGVHRISAPAPSADTPAVSLAVDKTFSVPPDQRHLGVILVKIGFK